MGHKDHILDIAKQRFDRFGFKKTTVDEISKDAGISKKTLYENFKSKEDIFVSLFIKEALTARKVILDKLGNIEDSLEKIGQFMLVSRDYFREEPFMVKVLQDENGLYAPFLKNKYRIFVEEGILNIFSNILRQGIEKGEFRHLNTHTVSYIIFKLFQAFTYAKTMPPQDGLTNDQSDLDEMVSFISEAIIRR
jgi:AcrR family transcriptional regulator